MGKDIYGGTYSDVMTNFLILKCPKSALEGYQYRMLAVNRIQGLLPCSLRSIDGETFLYYDITARQSLARRYERCSIPGAEMKQILYSLAEMMRSLAEFLLDGECLFLDPEYIFYDYLSCGYCYTYYPEHRKDAGIKDLLKYLAEKADTEAADAAAVVYRLQSLSEQAVFTMNEALLDQEFGQTDQKDASEQGLEEEEDIVRKVMRADLRVRNHGERQEDDDLISGLSFDDETDADENTMAHAASEEEGEQDGIRRRSGRRRRKDLRSKIPTGILVLAILLLVLAGTLQAVIMFVPIQANMISTLQMGAIVCLILSVLASSCGILVLIRRKQRQRQEEERRQEEEKHNAMVPSAEF